MICPHFGTCGGCVTQDVPYPLQLERKQVTLDVLLRDALGERAPAVRPALGLRVDEDGMPWRFRHKAAFVFGESPRNPRALVMGHFAAGSQRIVPVETCPVHGERANRLAFALRDQLVKARIPAAGSALDGILRHVVIRTSRDETEAVVMLVVTRNDKSLRRPLRAFLAGPDPPTGLLVNVHYRPGPYMVGDETIRIAGRGSIRENALGPAFLVSPTAFFQTNPEAAAALLADVVTQVGAVDDAGIVADLYAGSGLFAVPLALGGHTVVAVEENGQAVRDGETNARLNRVAPDKLRFVRGRVEDAVDRLGRTPPNVVVLDPPRQGCGAGVIRRVFADLRPARAIYVSCDPVSLARDLVDITGAGYAAVRAQPVDMFPHTPHIESVVTLERTPAARRGARPVNRSARVRSGAAAGNGGLVGFR
jgi:23S rRNA (uracil1939-C5)-methyltransferase